MAQVDLIWPSKWTITKGLFLLSRYFAAVDVPLMVYYAVAPDLSVHRCHQLHAVVIWLNLLGIAFAEVIFVFRTFALSGRNRKVLAVFGTLCMGSLVASAVLIVLFNQTVIFEPPLLPTIPGCFFNYFLTGGTLKYVAIPFSLALFIDICVVVYTIWIGVKKYRHSTNPLIGTLYRDGITYFAFLCTISAANVFILLAGPRDP
ncbi:hypothetical protein DFH06DRAFT_1341715 [Mycena polygramma]|nr:hypothetical protein DFH06DRAFT_1341715 [Mycena polygramma]